jgi:hypothetical protein
MSESYKALCSDYYVNLKLQLKLELPRSRETVLDLFERVRKQFPSMSSFRRYKDELALESPPTEFPHRWVALRASSLRAGVVNAPAPEQSYGLHARLLDLAPAFLSISALDVEYVELLFGFDLSATGNHDAIVLDALYAGSPLQALIDLPNARPVDCQPLIGLSIGNRGEAEVYFEVKTRQQEGHMPRVDPDGGADPISIYCTLRRFGPFSDVKDLPAVLGQLAKAGEELIERRVVPGLIVPIREAIGSSNA